MILSSPPPSKARVCSEASLGGPMIAASGEGCVGTFLASLGERGWSQERARKIHIF